MTSAPLPAALFDFQDHLWVLHCAKGPAPQEAVTALSALLSKELHPWDLDMASEWAGIPEGLRLEAAKVIGGRAEDISVSTSTSAGLVAVAQGFPFRKGDEVLAPLGEFPSNVWPWKALESRGVQFREVSLWDGQRSGAESLDSLPPQATDFEARILAAISPRTRLVAVSWVRFQDGLKLDLDRLGMACQERGVAFVVDGIQGVGTHLPSLQYVDAFACGGQKGCLGPQGHGFLWTSAAFRNQLVPQGSWLSVEGGAELARTVTDPRRDWLPDGRRLECGSLSLLGSLALREGLRTLNSAGVIAISTHVDRLQARLLERLAGSPALSSEAHRLEALRLAGRLGPLLCLHHEGKGSGFLAACLKEAQHRAIHASAREGYLRVALHGWHTEADISRLADWLEQAYLSGIDS